MSEIGMIAVAIAKKREDEEAGLDFSGPIPKNAPIMVLVRRTRILFKKIKRRLQRLRR